MIFSKKTVLLTGASSGIGRALAIKLARYDINLAILARREDKLSELKTELPDNPANLLPLKCDVKDKKEVEAAFNRVIQEFGSIDIAILNAGISFRNTPEAFDSRAAEETFGVNFLGAVYWIEKLLPDFMDRRTGMIVGVSSLADNRGFSKSGFYCASKAALSIFLEGLRSEMMKYNVKVITVKPGFVRTPMTDKNEFYMPFLMPVERAADKIIKGIKKEKNIISFPLPTVIGQKIIGILPESLIRFIDNRKPGS